MNRKVLFFSVNILFAFFAISVTAQTPLQSALVKVDESGQITYVKDALGFVIPDFSHAGYKNGNEPVPNYNPTPDRIVRVSPSSNESTNVSNINNAISSLASKTPEANGMRGIVQLDAGRFNINDQINLNVSGVVLRGAGCGPDKVTTSLTTTDLQTMTMIYRTGTSNALDIRVLVMGPTNANTASWGTNTNNETNKTNITTPKVMPGDFSFQVASTAGYSVGDAVCIKYPTTDALLAALWYGGNSNWVGQKLEAQKWVPSNLNFSYHRYVKKIEGNTITVDAPFFYCLDSQYSQPYVHRITNGTSTMNMGVEDLRISMDPTPTTNTSTNSDQDCIKMNALENCWAKNLHLSDFVHGGIKTEGVTRTTIENVRAVDCSGQISSANRYNFENYNRSQLILYKNCLMRNGRHHWVANSGHAVSGIVVLNCTSTSANAAAEGHRYLAHGILIDGWKETNWTFANSSHRIGFFLRDNMGTNHGWGAVQSVLWNCDLQNGLVYHDKIPTGQNYSIGTRASAIRRYSNSDYIKDPNGNATIPNPYVTGYVEHSTIVANQASLASTPHRLVHPKSLYEAQLAARTVTIPFTIKEHPKDVQTCVNNTVTLSVTATAQDMNALSYRWKKDGNVVGGATQKTLTFNRAAYSDSGVYTVEVTYSGLTLESEPAELIVLAPLPELQFSEIPEHIYAGSKYQIMVGDPVTGAYPYVTGYEWTYTGTGVSISQPASNPVQLSVNEYATNGILRVKVSHPCGTKMLERSVTIEKLTANPETEAENIRIFPNPANDAVYIQNIRAVQHIEIINAAGQTVYSQLVTASDNELVVPLSSFTTGTYLVRLLYESGHVKTIKFVK